MTHSIYKKNRRTCFFWERGGKSHCKQYRGEGIQMTERKTLLSELRHFNNPGWPCCTFLALPSLWPGFESHQGRHMGLSFSVPNWFWGFPHLQNWTFLRLHRFFRLASYSAICAFEESLVSLPEIGADDDADDDKNSVIRTRWICHQWNST